MRGGRRWAGCFPLTLGLWPQSYPHWPLEAQAWGAFFREPYSSPPHQPPSMGLQQIASSPSGSPFHSSDLWSKVGGNMPSSLPLFSPTVASLPVPCLPLQLLQPLCHRPLPGGRASRGSISGAKVLRACAGSVNRKAAPCVSAFHPWSL